MKYQAPQGFVREIGLFGLTMAGVGSMIGSGWLFSAYLAAQLAGPAAIFCWLICGAVIMLVALTISELASAFPKSGGMVRYFEFSHGSLAGFTLAWANWLGIVATIAAEAEGSIQYASSWHQPWAKNLYSINTHSLTSTGIAGASLLLVFYFLVNYWSIKLFVRFISTITVFKVIVPILTGTMLIYAGFHPGNFTQVGHSLVPYGWSSVLTAIVTCGIVLSFNGFQSPVNFAAEAKRPHINLPLSIIFSILIATTVYLLLQVAFIGAVTPATLTQIGWKGLDLHSPLVELALLFQLNFIAILIYINSFVSPSGTAVIYTATSARMLYGMERNGYMPKFMGALHPHYHVPRNALWFNLAICFVLMCCYRSWAHMVPIISIANIVAFIPGPIVLGGLRHVAPDLPRLFKLPWAGFTAPLSFILLTLLIYWGGWPLTGEVMLLLVSSLGVYFYYQYKQNWPNFAQQLHSTLWLITYFCGIVLVSYAGGKNFGGVGYVSSTVAQLILAFFALFIYHWAVRSAWRTPALKAWLKTHSTKNANCATK